MCEGILVARHCDQITRCIPVVLGALQLVSDHSYQCYTIIYCDMFKSCLSTLQQRGRSAWAEFTCADLMNCTGKLQQVTCKGICSVQVGCVDCILQKIIPKIIPVSCKKQQRLFCNIEEIWSVIRYQQLLLAAHHWNHLGSKTKAWACSLPGQKEPLSTVDQAKHGGKRLYHPPQPEFLQPGNKLSVLNKQDFTHSPTASCFSVLE